jgi:hypothetical protein
MYKIIKREVLAGRLKELDGDKRTTLNQFKNIFFGRHTDISDDTYTSYDLAIRLFIDSVGGSTILSRIDHKHFEKFKSDCRARGVKKYSINVYLQHLRTFFNKALKWQFLSNKVEIEFFKIGKRHRGLYPGPKRSSCIDTRNNTIIHYIVLSNSLYGQACVGQRYSI